MSSKYLFAVLTLMSLSACGSAHDPTIDVGEDFAPYVSRFEAVAREQGQPVQVVDLKIAFGKTDRPTQRALCDIRPGETPTIIVQQGAWDLMDDAAREEVLFHEMGHCVLRRKHQSEVSERGHPASLMNPYVIDSATYSSNRDHYLRELFSKQGEF